ncbi:hypothetical protein ACEPPN_017831 [Leptodophora sp. 'Broadleaf-Isolate-01']
MSGWRLDGVTLPRFPEADDLEHIFLYFLTRIIRRNYAMASTVPVVSLVGLQRFTLFTSLPPELRFIIWQLSLSPRVVEVLASNYCTTGFYSQAVLPSTLHVCRESRQAVAALYSHCFGSFLQPERVRFNFDLDVLYLDISQEEDGLHRLFGVLKRTELTALKYVAIDEAYLIEVVANPLSTSAGLKNALKAMQNLKELIVVRDITTERTNRYLDPTV